MQIIIATASLYHPYRMTEFFHSVEFYVIMTFAAAAVIAMCARPSSRGEALTHLVSGWLADGDAEAEPALHVECLDNGDVKLRRTGLQNVYATGAVSLAITQIGFDIAIIERVVEGTPVDGAFVHEAVSTLTFMAQDWYHIKYTDEKTGRFAAFTLHVRPGLTQTIPLKQ
jgi:hypothetical protein